MTATINIDRRQIQAMARPERTAPAKVALRAGAVHFTMPTPPSVNALFRNVKGRGRVKTEAYFDFIQMGITAIRNQQVPALSGPVIMVYGIERIARNALEADISNRLKAIEDTIVKAGVIEDDRFVTGIAISWLPRANGLAHVSIMPVAQADFRFHPSPDGSCGAWIRSEPQPSGDD